MARVHLTARVTGLLAGAVLGASMALTVAAPASVASVARPVAGAMAAGPAAAGPSGVRAKAAAIEVASTGRLLWSRGLNTDARWPASPR